MDIDVAKVRRESLRWLILLAYYNARPVDLVEAVVLATAQGVYPDASVLEVRREIDYLADRQLVEVRKDPAGPWWGNLTRLGTDVVEYTVDCQPGIARPVRYW
ncbi:hypothetical protein GCM10027396_28400 [Insolitispirillum peregrinum]